MSAYDFSGSMKPEFNFAKTICPKDTEMSLYENFYILLQF